MTTQALKPPTTAIHYPDTDGQPMAESDETRKLMVECIEVLDHHFRNRPDVYVSGNLLIYYREGDPKRSVSPDVLVAFGVPKHARKIYQTWVEGKMPDFVLEISSDSTWRKDIGLKNGLYFTLGVQEYFLFDASGGRLEQPVLGFKRDLDGFSELPADEAGWIESSILGLRMREEGGRLRFYDKSTGQLLLTATEQARQERDAAERRAQSLEERLLRMEEENRRLREGR